MKKLKKIALVALTTLAFVSCKNENTESNEVIPTETAVDSSATSEITANLETASISIEGMTCQMGCANAIESKLGNLEGVKEAKVDFENKTATVSFDATKQTPESLTKTVEGVAGGDTYKVTAFESKANTKG